MVAEKLSSEVFVDVLLVGIVLLGFWSHSPLATSITPSNHIAPEDVCLA